jgi:hypothetical protein
MNSFFFKAEFESIVLKLNKWALLKDRYIIIATIDVGS